MSGGASRVLGLRELLVPQPAALPAQEPAAQRPDPQAELEEQRKRVYEEARADGFAAGEAAARDAMDRAKRDAVAAVKAASEHGERELAEATRRFVELAAALERQQAAWEAQVEDAACTIAVAALARVLGERTEDGSAIAAVCAQALDEFRHRPAVLRVSVDDHARIAGLPLLPGVTVEADARLAAGECEVESLRGLYETSLATRLRAIVDALVGADP